ncbi:MAG: IPT/TIG domain-containing protein [Bacteroidota bacterium]|nr:IPT/TIG domain-containing protein [Bacteroidota bacterium]
MKYFYRLGLFLGLLVQVLLRPAGAAAAPFTPGNIVIARVGDGTAALTSAATAVFLDEYARNASGVYVLVQSVALPTAASGTNRALTASGTATAELALARTANGSALVLAGYNAAPGIAAIPATSSTDYVRVVGLVGADGLFDTSTSLGSAFSGTATTSSAARTVASADGSSFYVAGSGSPSNVQYIALGSASPTAITGTSIASRVLNITGGSLYLSSAAGINQIGSGLPTTAGQAATLLPGFSGTLSPYGFYFADLSATVPGVDVVYIADDRGATGGIQKWSLVGSTWTLNGTIASTSAATVRGLDGNTTGTAVSLIATSPTGMFILSDNSGYNVAPTLTALPAAVATAPTNTAFRGVAFAPTAPSALPTITSFTPTSGATGATVTITGTDFTGATAVTLNGVAITGFTVVNSTTITFTVPAGATSGPIAVTTPGGTATSASSFTVAAPSAAPTVSSLSPSAAVAGSGSFTLTVTGTGFSSGTVISFNGTALTTTFVSATQVSAIVPAAALATAGAYPVTATNPAPGGGTSAAVNFTVTAPAPTITSFTPTSGPISTTAPTTVTITGMGFTGATGVTLNGVAITGFTVVNSTTITFTIPGGATSGIITVTTPNGTATSTASFVVTPAITALSPTAQVVGGPALTLTITGTNFTAASTVNFNNVAYTPTSATATTIVVTIPASVLSTLGAYPVSVTTAGGTSNVFTFTVSNASTAGAYENFEAGTKTSYTTGPVTLASGVWSFANALIGDSFADKFNGLKSARLRTGGAIAMSFDKPDGAGTVVINAALYGTTDTGASFLLEQSTDGGITYSGVAGAPAALTGTLTPYTFTVSTAGNIRFRISNTVTATTNTFPRISIDDISISSYVAPPTITGFTPITGGPGTVVTLTGTNLTGATTITIGTFTVTNFTVVNGTTITFVVPNGTGSVNGFVAVTTPGGTATSTTRFSLVSATLAANALPGLTVFPNPATDRLTVALPTAAPATVALRDLAGRLVLAPAPLGADHQLRLPASLASGVYLLEVRQGTAVAIRRIEKN